MSQPESVEERERFEARPSRWPNLCAWAAIAVALLLQYGLFRQYALREVVWAYPSSHDQTQYLVDSYDVYEHILDQGFLAGVRYGVHLAVAQGTILHNQAALFYLVAGPGRLSALTLNFLYFVLLQVVLAWTLHRLTRRWSMVGIGLGLLLTALTPFFWAGGLMDFRIDFAAMCLFGVVLCLAIQSNLFASRRGSLVVGFAAAYLVLFRYLTLVYLAGILAPFVGFLLLRLWWLRRDALTRRLEWHRLVNLALASAIVAGLAAPFLWHARRSLQEYYLQGHLPGAETKIRVLMDGHSLQYYPRTLLEAQAGPLFVKLAVLTVLGAVLLSWTRRARTSPFGGESEASDRRSVWRVLAIAVVAVPAFWIVNTLSWDGPKLWWASGLLAAAALGLSVLQRWQIGRPALERPLPAIPAVVFLTLALVVPLVILTVDLHRSPVVVSVAIPALLWLVLGLVVLSTGRACDDDNRPWLEHGLRGLAAVAVLSAGWLQLSQYTQHWKMTRNRPDMEQLLLLHDAIGRTCDECHILKPEVALTTNVDYLPGRITGVLAYERLGVLRRIDSILGGYYKVTEEDARRCLERCHFAIIGRPAPVVTPFDHAMIEMMPRLRDYCEKHLVRLGTYRIFGDDVIVYARKMWTEGGDAGWITSAGLKVKAPGRVLRSNKIVLYGRLVMPGESRIPAVRAMLSIPGQSPRTLAAELKQEGPFYAITIDRVDVPVPSEEIAEIQLTFDRYFVPKDMGISEDARQLVLPTPEKIVLLP